MRVISYRAGESWRAGIEVGDEVADAQRVAERAGWNGSAAGLSQGRAMAALDSDSRERLAEALTAGLEELRAAGAVFERAALHLGPPVWDPQKIICIGVNYSDGIEVIGRGAPGAPMFFSKFANSLIGPTEEIVPPAPIEQVDYEAELAIVIGTRGRDIEVTAALDHVAGALAFNDISARDLQTACSLWTGGKTIDTFGPCGPALVTLDELGDLQQLAVRARINGEIVQDGSTAAMIFSVAETIAYLSRIMTLEPGDIIATGAPANVANGDGRHAFLRPGDIVETEIEKIGTLRNRVAPAV